MNVFRGGGFVNAVDFSPDSACLAAACIDRTVRVFGADELGEELRVFRGHTHMVRDVSFAP